MVVSVQGMNAMQHSRRFYLLQSMHWGILPAHLQVNNPNLLPLRIQPQMLSHTMKLLYGIQKVAG